MTTSIKPSANIPATQNEDWGFWGTMKMQAPAAWQLALPATATATDCDPDAVRAFLDSRHGRQFADDVLNQLVTGRALPDAIQAATAQWMGWTITRQTSKEYGIPKGLPYLTGFVIHCAIIEESIAA